MGPDPKTFRTTRARCRRSAKTLSTLSNGRFNQHRTMMGRFGITSRNMGKNKCLHVEHIVYKEISKCSKPMLGYMYSHILIFVLTMFMLVFIPLPETYEVYY